MHPIRYEDRMQNIPMKWDQKHTMTNVMRDGIGNGDRKSPSQSSTTSRQ